MRILASFDRCANGAPAGEHGHFNRRRAVIRLIYRQGSRDSGECPPVEVNPVAGAANAALACMLRFREFPRGEVSELDQIVPFFRIPLRPQIFRTARKTVQMVGTGRDRKVMRADAVRREVCHPDESPKERPLFHRIFNAIIDARRCTVQFPR